MLTHELLPNEGILIIQPEGSLEASDFAAIAQQIDPYIEANGMLRGILIDAATFPGWKDFAALVAHLKFVQGHHRHVKKVAAVSDSALLATAPTIASHFVQAEVRHFPHADRDQALAWLHEPPTSPAH